MANLSRNTHFGNRAKSLLDERGQSIRRAAIETGIDRLTLANMLAGAVPRLEHVEAFARTYGQDVNEWRRLAGFPCVESPGIEAAAPELLAACEAQERAWLHRTNCLDCQARAACQEADRLAFEAHCELSRALAKARGAEVPRG